MDLKIRNPANFKFTGGYNPSATALSDALVSPNPGRIQGVVRGKAQNDIPRFTKRVIAVMARLLPEPKILKTRGIVMLYLATRQPGRWLYYHGNSRDL